MTDTDNPSNDECPACEPKYSRQDFLRKLVKRAAITGAIVAAPAVLDKFLVPPVYAMPSTKPGQGT